MTEPLVLLLEPSDGRGLLPESVDLVAQLLVLLLQGRELVGGTAQPVDLAPEPLHLVVVLGHGATGLSRVDLTAKMVVLLRELDQRRLDLVDEDVHIGHFVAVSAGHVEPGLADLVQGHRHGSVHLGERSGDRVTLGGQPVARAHDPVIGVVRLLLRPVRYQCLATSG